MTENGYAGAGMMAEVVRNTSGWEATRKGAVSQDLWNEIHAVYAKDKHGLKLKEWMDQVNPHTRQEILATLLEAARKGDWKAGGNWPGNTPATLPNMEIVRDWQRAGTRSSKRRFRPS